MSSLKQLAFFPFTFQASVLSASGVYSFIDPWTHSFKKDVEPLLNLTGAMSRLLKREGSLHKRGN
jgi:hypothetical protein